MTTPKDIQKPQEVVNKSLTVDRNILKQTVELNKEVVNQQINVTTKVTSEEVKDKQGVTNKYISHQILAEPVRVVSPESIINAAIAAVNVLGQAIINPIKEKLEITSQVSQDPALVNNSQIVDCIDKASKKCTTIAQTQATNAQLANGHFINAAYNSAFFTGNSLNFTSDTSTLVASPYTGFTSQDISITGNNSITQVSDFKLGTYKQKADFIEGMRLTQSQTSLRVSTELNEDISKVSSYIGIDSIKTMGKDNSVIADNNLVALSGGTTQLASYGNMGMQSNGNIAIMSAKPNNSDLPIAASGEELIESINLPTTISIINSNPDYTDIFLMSNNGILSSTTKSQFNISSELNVTVGEKGAALTSNKFTFSGNPEGGTYSIGGRTFLGKFSFPIMDFGVAELLDIPALPVLPKTSKQKLENCIPKKYKDAAEDNFFYPDLPSNSDNSIEGISYLNPDELINSNSDFKITPPIIPSSSNKIQLPSISLPLNKGNKLPAPTISSNKKLEGETKIISALTPLGILSTRFTQESKDVLSDISILEGLTINSFTDYLEEIDILDNLALSLQDASNIINTDFINSFTKNVIPNIFSNILQYTDFFIELLNVSQETLNQFQLTIDNFKNLDKNRVQAILTLIEEYPKLKDKIIELVNTAKLVPAIGFFSGITNIISIVKSNITKYKDLTKLPNIIKGGDFKEIYNFTKPYIAKTLKGTPLNSIIQDSNLLETLLNFGTDITKGNLTKEERDNLLKNTIDKVYNENVKKVLEKQVSDILGSNLQSAIPLIKDILLKIKLGSTIYPEDYINQFSDILYNLTGNKNITKAVAIYDDLSKIIKASKDGDILSIILGDNSQNLLSNVLGEENAGKIGKVFNLVKSSIGVYESVKLLPDLINLMNEYKIPAINQVGIALNCLDLFNKTKSLIDSIGALKGNKQTASLIENAGRIAELKNTLDTLDDDTLLKINPQLKEDLKEDIDLIEYKRVLNSNLNLDECFKLPKLNIFQSEIEVLEVQPEIIVFSIVNLDLYNSDLNILPKVNDLIQIKVDGFYSNTTKEYLVPYQTDFQYTPSVYTFIISEFNISNNIGVAIYDKLYSSIILENNEGVLYKFNTEALGNTLSPDIVDSYILA